METSQANNAEETKVQDRDVYVISKDKAEKQQLIIHRQQTQTEVYTPLNTYRCMCLPVYVIKSLYYIYLLRYMYVFYIISGTETRYKGCKSRS